MTGEMRATREAIHAGKRAWFSGRHSDDGVLLGAMHPDEWNAHSAAALREVELAEKVIETAKKVWECHGHTEWCERYLNPGSRLACDCGTEDLRDALQALAALDAAKGEKT